jgi:putative addiction module component (TIGR02574 family)
MTDRTQELLREVLELSAEDRAELAAALLASLDAADVTTAEIEAAWAAEMERRAGPTPRAAR